MCCGGYPNTGICLWSPAIDGRLLPGCRSRVPINTPINNACRLASAWASTTSQQHHPVLERHDHGVWLQPPVYVRVACKCSAARCRPMSCSRFAGWCACELLTDLDGLCPALHCMLAVSATRLALPEKGEAVCGCQRRAGWWGGMVGWWCRLIGEPIKPHTHARVQLAPRNEIEAPPPACRAAFPTHHRSLPTVVCLFSQPGL